MILVRQAMAGLGSVYALVYRYFNAFLFWFPGMARDRPCRKVAREIRTVLARHPGARVSIIAHSFGTYLVARLLRENPDVKLHRLILVRRHH